MNVHCGNCGQELLGAVNRCWRCGQPFVPVPESNEARRVRAAAGDYVPETPLEAEVLYEDAPQDQRRKRQGSPFVDGFSPALQVPRRSVCHRLRFSSAIAAAGSILLGVVTLFVAVTFPLVAIAIGGLGVASGCCGLRNNRPAPAISGLLVCCFALALALFMLAVELYAQRYGVPPWETALPRLNG